MSFPKIVLLMKKCFYREQYDKEEKKRRSDEAKLKMASLIKSGKYDLG